MNENAWIINKNLIKICSWVFYWQQLSSNSANGLAANHQHLDCLFNRLLHPQQIHSELWITYSLWLNPLLKAFTFKVASWGLHIRVWDTRVTTRVVLISALNIWIRILNESVLLMIIAPFRWPTISVGGGFPNMFVLYCLSMGWMEFG